MIEFKKKLKRIYDYLDRNDKEGMILARRDNFAWLTGGGESGVILNAETGFLLLTITKEHRYVTAMRADIDRAMEEQLADLGFEACPLNWKDISKEECAMRLIPSGRAVSDIPLEGAAIDLNGIYKLHTPLSESEIRRYRCLGQTCEQILLNTTSQIRKGMAENSIRRILQQECTKHDVDTDVILIGGDERIGRYRHCTPTDQRVQKTVLISPAFRKYGLHANLARMISFGEPDPQTKKRYEDVSKIQAEIIAMTQQDTLFSDIYKKQEQLYHQMHYETDWMEHMHGAPTGYMISDAGVLFSQDRRMNLNEAYEWYITVTGAKSAELVLNNQGHIEVPSVTGIWPTTLYTTSAGAQILLPEIYIAQEELL